MLQYQPLTSEQIRTNPTAAVAQITNTVARPGPLTTEWWTILLAGAVSSVLALVGLPGSAATQIAGVVAPIAIALVYAYVRARTKGALADALEAIFPEAGTTTPPPPPPGGGASATPTDGPAAVNGSTDLAVGQTAD
jgi:hypothetical protein